ncbi:hypothetical protein ES703_112723 [subsurface metagenome]
MAGRLPRFNPLDKFKGALVQGQRQIGKAASDIRSVADELGHAGSGQTFSQEKGDVAPSPPAAPSLTSKSKLTPEETLAYQNREIARELWMLEKHLAQGCRIPDKTGTPIPCDCCEKGVFIAALAFEAIPIAERASLPSEVYQEVSTWAEKIEPMVTVAAVESGAYDYKVLSGEASARR